MILTIKIDTKAASQTALKLLANRVRDRMIMLAKSNLSPRTAQIYVKSLSKVTISGNTAEFLLQGWLANALELGVSPYDMKIGLLSSDKVKISRTGNTYQRVPVSLDPLIVRTVSLKSKPGSWIHPGLFPRDFWGKATYSLNYDIK